MALEATGGYEFLVARTLQAAGLAVDVVNPNHVRQFACVMGRLARIETLDAWVLAHFAEVICPAPRFLADAQTEQL